MANIKSAKKRILVTAKKTMRNKIVKSKVKTEIKKVLNSIKERNKEDAKINLQSANRAIDKACTKGIFHKNNAARKKSRLTKAVNKIS